MIESEENEDFAGLPVAYSPLEMIVRGMMPQFLNQETDVLDPEAMKFVLEGWDGRLQPNGVRVDGRHKVTVADPMCRELHDDMYAWVVTDKGLQDLQAKHPQRVRSMQLDNKSTPSIVWVGLREQSILTDDDELPVLHCVMVGGPPVLEEICKEG